MRCIFGLLLGQQLYSDHTSIALDQERLELSFPSMGLVTHYKDILELTPQQAAIYDAAADGAIAEVGWCEQFYLSTLSWGLRWGMELPALTRSPAGAGQIGGLALEPGTLWETREHVEQKFFETLHALLPQQGATIILLQESRERARVFRAAMPPTSCPDLIGFLAEQLPCALNHPDAGPVVETYRQGANALATGRATEIGGLSELRDGIKEGRLDQDDVAEWYLSIGENSARVRNLVRETARLLHRQGCMDEVVFRRFTDSMYPRMIDRTHGTMRRLGERMDETDDDHERVRLAALVKEIEEAAGEVWARRRALYDAAYEKDAIETWAEAMAAQAFGQGPWVEFHTAFAADRGNVAPLPEHLEAEARRVEQEQLQPPRRRPAIPMRGDDGDALRTMIISVADLVGIRYQWYLPDLLESTPAAADAQVAQLVETYRVELAQLAARFPEVERRYRDLGDMEDADEQSSRRFAPVLRDLVTIVRAIDALNAKSLAELADLGHDAVRQQAIEAAYPAVFMPSPMHQLFDRMSQRGSGLTDEERADVATLQSDFLSDEETIRQRLVKALADWESIDSTLARIEEARRNDQISAWRVWREGEHPAITLWNEQTDHVRRTWVRLSAVFPRDRRAELPASIGMALTLGDSLNPD